MTKIDQNLPTSHQKAHEPVEIWEATGQKEKHQVEKKKRFRARQVRWETETGLTYRPQRRFWRHRKK